MSNEEMLYFKKTLITTVQSAIQEKTTKFGRLPKSIDICSCMSTLNDLRKSLLYKDFIDRVELFFIMHENEPIEIRAKYIKPEVPKVPKTRRAKIKRIQN